jgi:carboxypeptidase Taq
LTTRRQEVLLRPGQRYRAADLCRRVTGKALSHQPLLSYLRHKYAPLYDV